VCEQIRVGAYYRHKMNLDLDGDFKAKSLNPIVFGGGATSFQTGEEYEFTLPGAAGVGVSWTSADRLLTINADFESDFWKQYRRVRVELDAPLTAFGVPVVTGDNLSSKPDWFNSWGARIGAQYMLASEWALRGGYFYDSTPIPGHTIEPGIPGSDRHGVALGIGYGETAWSLDFAYMIVFMVDRHVNNAATAPQNPAQTGTYSSDPEHEFVVGFTLRN
jgi:long-subunit fatty acid transport protein